MLIHLYFNISKLIYSFVSRRELKFVLAETLGSLLTILIGIFFSQFILVLIKIFVIRLFPNNFGFNGIIFFLNGGLYTILFVTFSLLARLLSPQNPVEVPEAPKNKRKTPIGIIDFSWLSILGFTYGGILFATSFPIFKNKINLGMGKDYYSLYYNEVNYLFGKSIDLIFILGTILAVCMSIIWAGQIWRKRDTKSRNDYHGTTLASIKMVIAFFLIFIATILWISLPLYNLLTSIKNYL